MNKVIKEIAKKVLPILKKNKVAKAGIFGSYARGEHKKSSDIDMLIEVKGNLMDVMKIEAQLVKKLHKKVDLLTYNGVNHLLKDKIFSEEVRIL
jgi:uncharacterized protein